MDARASTRSWLESGMNVNHEQQCTSAELYSNAKQDDSLDHNAMVRSNIDNEAALAQLLFMVGNAMFDHGMLHALRATVNGVKHPTGTTFGNMGISISMAVPLLMIIASGDGGEMT